MKEVNQQQAVKNDNQKNTCFTRFCRVCRVFCTRFARFKFHFCWGEDEMCLFTSPGNGANWTHDSDFHAANLRGLNGF